ncbi:MAG: hypothetical protein COB85_05855 [Bacteroidetes bacterium]|nr:MAG: hypothetical protein COB85_05855 [Bacteroidota bacterium]
MKEKAVLFGRNRSIVGIISTSESKSNNGKLPSVILLNAGMLHRVGPNRLNVKIARALVKNGLMVLRFDFSGLGDTATRQDTLSFEEGNVQELKDAMDFLGSKSFIIIGICSGGRVAWETANMDSRIAGIIFVESMYIRTFYYHINRMLNLQKWYRLLSGQSYMWHLLKQQVLNILNKPSLENLSASTGLVDLGSSLPGTDSYRLTGKELRSSAKCGIQLLFVYRDGNETRYNYKIKRSDEKIIALELPENIDVEFVKEADHTFTLLSSQYLLLNIIDNWFRHRIYR